MVAILEIKPESPPKYNKKGIFGNLKEEVEFKKDVVKNLDMMSPDVRLDSALAKEIEDAQPKANALTSPATSKKTKDLSYAGFQTGIKVTRTHNGPALGPYHVRYNFSNDKDGNFRRMDTKSGRVFNNPVNFIKKSQGYRFSKNLDDQFNKTADNLRKMSSPASQRSEVDLLPNLNLEDATGGIPLTKRTSYLASMTTPKY